MTKIDVREAEAGPELDAACAEAMGWERSTGGWLWRANESGTHVRSICDWGPSTDIEGAWELVEAMRHAAWDISVRAVVAMPDECSVYKDDEHGVEIEVLAIADTAPLAICRAFLLASGIEEIETDRGRSD